MPFSFVVRLEHGIVYRGIEVVLGGLTSLYRWGARLVTSASCGVMALLLVATIGGVYGVFRVTPTTLVPIEDRGEFMTFLRSPQGSTAAYTDRAMRQVEEAILTLPERDTVFAAVAMSMGGPCGYVGRHRIHETD